MNTKQTRTIDFSGLLFLFFSTILFFSACDGETDEEIVEVVGMKPVYMKKTEAKTIYATEPQPIISPGKIYMKKPYMFIAEKGKGVHIVNNTNPENPEKLAFIHVPGNNDIAVRAHILFVDNFTDLVSIDIHDLSNIKVVNRIKDAFPIDLQMYPPNYSGYFECVDTTKGYVEKWIKAELKNPKCHK